MPLKKEHAFRIIKNYKSIISLKMDNIIDQMFQDGVFDLDDLEKIYSKPTQKEKNREFVTLLIRSHKRGYEVFIKCLKEDESNKEIAHQIETTQEEIILDEYMDHCIDDIISSRKGGKYLKKDFNLLCFGMSIAPAHLQIVGTCLIFYQEDVNALPIYGLQKLHTKTHLFKLWRKKYSHIKQLLKGLRF